MDRKTRLERHMHKLFGAGSDIPRLVIISQSPTFNNPTVQPDYEGERGHFTKKDGAIFRLWKLLGQVGLLDSHKVEEAKRTKDPDRRAKNINSIVSDAGIYITDLVKCPCRNEEVSLGAKQCKNILIEQLRVIQPKLICTISKMAYNILTETEFANRTFRCPFPVQDSRITDKDRLNCLREVVAKMAIR